MKKYPVWINDHNQKAVLVKDINEELSRILQQQKTDSADGVRRSISNLLDKLEKP
jgi:hypothetical protein